MILLRASTILSGQWETLESFIYCKRNEIQWKSILLCLAQPSLYSCSCTSAIHSRSGMLLPSSSSLCWYSTMLVHREGGAICFALLYRICRICFLVYSFDCACRSNGKKRKVSAQRYQTLAYTRTRTHQHTSLHIWITFNPIVFVRLMNVRAIVTDSTETMRKGWDKHSHICKDYEFNSCVFVCS